MEAPYVYFEEVARQGSIRQAADRLNVSASSISRQIAKLEHELGVSLLARHSHGVKLTPAGEILARFVHNRSRDFLRLRGLIDELKQLERGHVSIRSVEGMLDGFLPRTVSAFAEKHPHLTYEIMVAGTEDVMRAVAEDRCDIGLAFEPRSRHDVEVVARIPQPVLAVVARDHPLADRELLQIADLKGIPVGLPDRSFGIRHIVDAAMEAKGMALDLRLETNSIDMARQFAEAGMGLTFLPLFAFEREAKAGGLVGVAVNDEHFTSATAQICKHAEFELTWAAQAVLDGLIEASAKGLVLP